MTPEEAKQKFAAAEQATDTFLERLAASPYTAPICAVIAVLFIVLSFVW